MVKVDDSGPAMTLRVRTIADRIEEETRRLIDLGDRVDL
jgi:hypothetical protein